MKKRIDFTLVLPCYNEELLFDASVSRIYDTLANSRFSFEIIFVDDASLDRTPQKILTFCKKHPDCRAIFHKENTGRGRTVADGIRASYGVAAGYIDIDCEVSPVYISSMVSLILANRADVVIGSRIYRTSLFSITREVLSRGYRWLSDQVIATGGLDTETGYKFFKRTKILPILDKTQHPHWFWDTELMVLAKRQGLRIVEVPVLFLRRTDKKSSVRIFHDMLDYTISLWQLRKRLNR